MFRPPAHAVTLELSSTLDVPPFPPDGWGGELLDRSLRDAALDEIARTQARLLHRLLLRLPMLCSCHSLLESCGG